MNHPTADALLRYRFETTDEAETRELAAHLRTCSACAARFAAIGLSVDKLGAYDVEHELDPALVVRAVAQASAAPADKVDDEEPAPKPGFFAWLGFQPGARFQEARRAAVLVLLGSAVLLGAGHGVVSMRHVKTDTRVWGESSLLPGSRSHARIQVVVPGSQQPVADADVHVTLVAGPKRFPLFTGRTNAAGEVNAMLEIPDEELGAAQLEVTTSARGEDDVVLQPVVIGRDFKVHLSTDKPLYQPGQTIHVRALALQSPALTPAKGREVVFEVLDAKGTRIAGHRLNASAFGVAAWNVELSSELALGDYQVSAQVGARRTEVAVKVSRYTLPKFKLTVKGTKDTVLAGETLRADLTARTFFGKPVENAKVRAVLTRENGALVAPELEGVTGKGGQLRLELEVPSYIADPGQPEALSLHLEVTDAAGQQERKTQLFTVARELLAIELFARHGGVAEGLPNTLYVLTTTPEGQAVPCQVTLTPSTGPDVQLRTGENGVGAVTFPVRNERSEFWVEATAVGPDGRRASRKVLLPYRKAGLDLEADRALYRPGEAVTVTVLARAAAASAQVRVFKEGRLVHTQQLALQGTTGQGVLALPAGLTGAVELEASLGGAGDTVTQRLIIAEPGGLSVKLSKDLDTHRPGATAKLRFEVKDAAGKPAVAVIGLAVVDESLWALTASKPAAARAFFLLDLALQAPRGPLSAAGLIAGNSFSAADQTAAKLLLSIAPPTARAPSFSQATLLAETDKLHSQQRSWEAFAWVAVNVLVAAFTLLLIVALIRFAVSWVTPIAVIVVGSFATSFASYRLRDEVFILFLVSYVLLWLTHSLVRKTMIWSWVVVPAVLVGGLFLLVANTRMGSMSADALAGNDGVGAEAQARGGRMFAPQAMMDERMQGSKGVAQGEGGAPPRREVRVRQHFPETMYVHPELITDEAGVATLDLVFADSITDWRLSALASTLDGRLGTMDAPLRVFQEFFVDLDTPVALVRGDSASVPIAVHNYLPTAQKIRLEVKKEPWFEVVGPSSFMLNLDGGAQGGQEVRIKVLKAGRHTLTVQADGTALSDAVARALLVTEAGQQKTQSVSGTLQANLTTQVALTVPESAVAGSTSLMLKVFPSQLASVLEGLEGSLRAPHGCFEQTSSTTYPNVLVWNYLQRTGKKSPAIEERARGFVALGYQKLLTFEVPGGGFEWFGRAPANQVLTAYGLMEFKDMAQVFPVDEKLIARTQAWLVGKQQLDGSWSPDASSLRDGLWKPGFDGRLMVSAYITWSLVESGYQGFALAPALAYLSARLGEVGDPYTLAMMAATFGRAGHSSAGEAAKKLVAGVKREKDLAWFAPADATLYYSRGVGGTIESTALAAYALMVGKREPQLVTELLRYIAANRDGQGGWHSTQGTVLALRTLLLATGEQTQDHELTVRVNGADAGTLKVQASSNVPALSDLAAKVKPGLNVIEVTGASDAQFQVVAVYTQPWREKGAEAGEPLTLAVEYGRTKTEVGGIVPVALKVTYAGADASGMVVVALGLPAGLGALTEDLQALVTSGAVARFEIGADVVNLYLDRLESKVPVSLALRLKAKSKVDTQGVGSLAFLYYHPAVRAVVAATAVKIE